MSQYFDLSIRRIEIKKPKRDLKPVIKLQDEVNKTLLSRERRKPSTVSRGRPAMRSMLA